MKWLTKVVDEVEKLHPKGEILVESGASPSGTYHLGHLREIITCDAILRELVRRGRSARHVHFVDDLDGLRKVPVNISADYEKQLGKSLCDIPAPDGKGSYADYFLSDFLSIAKVLGIDMEIIRSHEKYCAGFFAEAIEKTLENDDKIRQTLEKISGHKLDDHWSPVQIAEDEYLKNRKFISLDKSAKTISYQDAEGKNQTIGYNDGKVKLNWRIDWPARWWLLKINVEPAGRDHASAGGSFDTGLAIVKDVFGSDGPLPVPYDFVNRAGDTKKMSASKGTGISAKEVAEVLPPEITRYFMLRFPPEKRLYFDSAHGTAQLIDEFAELLAKTDKTPDEQHLIDTCLGDLETTISSVPFSHLVASYQAALKDPAKTLDIITRTDGEIAAGQADTIKRELGYIDNWLKHWAPEDVKFELLEHVDASKFNGEEKTYLSELSKKVAQAPQGADGEWFHKAIYELKETNNLSPEQVFKPLYKALIGKDRGPRAGWFLSILPRDWLIKRLKFEA